MTLISGFTSGYVCRHCWSTKAKTDCHCSVKQRTQMPGTRHSSGAKQPLHNSATVSFFYIIENSKDFLVDALMSARLWNTQESRIN